MATNQQDRSKGLLVWQGSSLPDYSPVGRRLPVIENSIVQVSPGPFAACAKIISGGGVTVIRSHVRSHSVGVVVLDPSITGFLMPLRWADGLRIDGVKAAPNVMHTAGADHTLYMRGGQREQFGCLFPRAQFVETLAALRGVDPDELPLTERAHAMPERAYAGLLIGLENAVAACRSACVGSTPPKAAHLFSEQVFELLLDACLQACPEPGTKSGRVRHASRIVRAAEEHFARAGNHKVSLADLCLAAGVGKTKLYAAFESHCGESPIAYFHKRRLSAARSLLLDGEPKPGAITRVALSAGLTELSRFARDYRRLYGESPSATLRHPDQGQTGG